MSPPPVVVSLQTTYTSLPDPDATCGGPELPGLLLKLTTSSKKLPLFSLVLIYTSFDNPWRGPARQTKYMLYAVVDISGHPESVSSLLRLSDSEKVLPAFSLTLHILPWECLAM